MVNIENGGADEINCGLMGWSRSNGSRVGLMGVGMGLMGVESV